MPTPNPKMAVPKILHNCCDFITFSSFFRPWAAFALRFFTSICARVGVRA
ncbi:MAG: hypothetical protein IJ012_06885 [Clostridia bacterium]|nr:hypothetical protein [Clostridia bacterium]